MAQQVKPDSEHKTIEMVENPIITSGVAVGTKTNDSLELPDLEVAEDDAGHKKMLKSGSANSWYFFLLRLLHFSIEHSFMFVAFVAFVALPFDITKVMFEGHSREGFTITSGIDSPEATDRLVFGFLPNTTEYNTDCSPDPVTKVAERICPSDEGSEERNSSCLDPQNLLNHTCDVCKMRGYPCQTVSLPATFTSYHYYNDDQKRHYYNEDRSHGVPSTNSVLNITNDRHGGYRWPGYDGRGDLVDKNLFCQDGYGLVMSADCQPRIFQTWYGVNTTEYAMWQLSRQTEISKGHPVWVIFPAFYFYLFHVLVCFVGVLFMLHGFRTTFNRPFGSFRYYQQCVQFKRSKMMQYYLMCFAFVVVADFMSLVVVGFAGDVTDKVQDNVFQLKMVLLFTSVLTGLVKGFDFDDDWYLHSETSLNNGCGCSRTSEIEFKDDVLLYDSFIDFIGPSDKTVSLVEAAAATYWCNGRMEPLRFLLRDGKRKKIAEKQIQLLCQEGSALQRRMLKEADVVRDMLDKKGGDGGGRGCCCC